MHDEPQSMTYDLDDDVWREERQSNAGTKTSAQPSGSAAAGHTSWSREIVRILGPGMLEVLSVIAHCSGIGIGIGIGIALALAHPELNGSIGHR